MTYYKGVNVNLSDLQLNKLKSAIKNDAKVALWLSQNRTGDNETYFPHKLSLTNRHVLSFCTTFIDNS